VFALALIRLYFHRLNGDDGLSVAGLDEVAAGLFRRRKLPFKCDLIISLLRQHRAGIHDDLLAIAILSNLKVDTARGGAAWNAIAAFDR
jgi:hypothetical protein